MLVPWKSLAVAMTVLLSFGSGSSLLGHDAPETFEVATATSDAVRLIAVGDIGTGKEEQYRVGQAIATVCAARGCDFILGLGDNIYESGVSSPHDPQFESKFEDPYAGLPYPWYLTLGNHDNSADPLVAGPCGDACDTGFGHWYAAGEHQVSYTFRDDRASEKWHMPARYYDFTAGPATFLSLDSGTLMYYGQAFPPTDVTILEQEEWVKEAMESSTTPWKVAFAHHPYISNGQHGNAGQYECNNQGYVPTDLCGVDYYAPGISGSYLKSFYESHLCDEVDLVLTGHDHDLQWLQPVAACGKTEFIVSGAGAKHRTLSDPQRNPAYFQAEETLGFFWLELAGDALTGAAYDDAAALLFERSLNKA